MALNRTFSASALLVTLAACTPGPVVGGPCTYDEMDFTASPTGYTENAVLFLNPDDEEFDIQKDAFTTVPGEDDTVTIHSMRIIDGTCTPEIYTVIEGDAAGVE